MEQEQVDCGRKPRQRENIRQKAIEPNTCEWRQSWVESHRLPITLQTEAAKSLGAGHWWVSGWGVELAKGGNKSRVCPIQKVCTLNPRKRYQNQWVNRHLIPEGGGWRGLGRESKNWIWIHCTNPRVNHKNPDTFTSTRTKTQRRSHQNHSWLQQNGQNGKDTQGWAHLQQEPFDATPWAALVIHKLSRADSSLSRGTGSKA